MSKGVGRAVGAACCAGLLLLAAPALAINRCVDRQTGQVTYSEKECPADQAGSRVQHVPKTPPQPIQSGPVSVGRGSSRQPNPGLLGPPEAGAMLALYREWVDAEELARSTPRIALAGPVASLQAFKRQAAELRVPACLDAAHRALARLTAGTADGALAFMSRDGLRDLVWNWVDRGPAIDNFEREVSAAECADKAAQQ